MTWVTWTASGVVFVEVFGSAVTFAGDALESVFFGDGGFVADDFFSGTGGGAFFVGDGGLDAFGGASVVTWVTWTAPGVLSDLGTGFILGPVPIRILNSLSTSLNLFSNSTSFSSIASTLSRVMSKSILSINPSALPRLISADSYLKTDDRLTTS